jgi:hypothetical protein
MTRRHRWPVLSLLLAVSALGLVPLHAQEEELPKEDPPPWGDLVSYEDPSLKQVDPLFGEPLDSYEGSEEFLELPLSDDESAASYVTWDFPLNCASFPAGRTVRPIRVAAANPRYFSFEQKPLILVGASADAGCLLRLTEIDQCSLTKYPTTFTLNENLSATSPVPLNKVRVWVAMGQGYPGAQQVPNSPFLWVAPAGQSAYWLLSGPGVAGSDYKAFFDRLRDVLNEARKHKLFVEVTFFAPYEGKDFDLGPWSKAGGRSKGPGPAGPLSPAGFSAAQYQVLNDTSSTAAVENERMRAYQAAIVKWTVDTLWCFDNVIWEIANEPEGRGPGGKAALPAAVSVWQKSMILEVRKAESPYLPRLEYGHLIAAQPFSLAGANALLTLYNPPGWTPNDKLPLDVQILNGHYTTVIASNVSTFGQSGTHALNAGAIDLLRDATLNKKRIPFGFNETTITNLIGERGTKSHLNGVVARGGPDSARAEAWEFFFSGGTAYDHYGYLGLGAAPNETSKKIRIQLGSLLDLYGKRLFDLPAPKPALTDFGTAKMANWFTAGSYEGWECRTKSQRLWAALETTVKNPANPAQTAYRALLLYLHHSTRRCKNDSEDYDRGCASGFIPFGSYDARVWTAAPPTPPTGCPNVPAGQPGYRETFTLSPGTYDVSWINPEFTLPYAGSPATQTVTCSTSCAITSPVYKFDILLRLVKR